MELLDILLLDLLVTFFLRMTHLRKKNLRKDPRWRSRANLRMLSVNWSVNESLKLRRTCSLGCFGKMGWTSWNCVTGGWTFLSFDHEPYRRDGKFVIHWVWTRYRSRECGGWAWKGKSPCVETHHCSWWQHFSRSRRWLVLRRHDWWSSKSFRFCLEETGCCECHSFWPLCFDTACFLLSERRGQVKQKTTCSQDMAVW